MNFDDTPQEAAFRAEAKAWIAANAPKQYEEELRKSSLGRTQLKGANILEVAKAWQKKKADAGWACLHWPKEYGGRGASPIERVIWQQEEGAVRQAQRNVHHRPWHVRADHDGVCRRGSEAPISAAARVGRGDLVPVVFRARRRLRRRGPAHARGKARRRVDHQRPEDLDVGRALFRLWHPSDPHRSQCAQAQGAHHVLPRHEEPGRRDQADQAGQRPIRLQRSLFYRREDSGRAAARRGQ